jgi:hypothetical protein
LGGCNIMCIFRNRRACTNAWHVICSQKNEKNPVAKFAKYYHFIIILLSSRECTFAHAESWHWVSCGMRTRKNLLLKFAKYYHFVIIVINNIQQENPPCWCLFLSFFRNQKMTFFVASKHETIMLSFFHHKSLNKFCYFFFSLCTKVKKFLRKWTKKYVQKWIPRNLFVKKRAVLGKFFGAFGRIFMRSHMV